MSTPVLYTASEVAKILRCDERRVRQLMRSGKLQYINLGGVRGMRIPGTFLDAFLATPEPAPAAVVCSNPRPFTPRSQQFITPSHRGKR